MAGCAFGYPLRTADYKEDFHLKSCSQEFSQLKTMRFFLFYHFIYKGVQFLFGHLFLYPFSRYFNKFNYISGDIL